MLRHSNSTLDSTGYIKVFFIPMVEVVDIIIGNQIYRISSVYRILRSIDFQRKLASSSLIL